jgi:hypothetical protein
MRRPPARRWAAAERASRHILAATLCAIVVLAIAPHGTTPGSADWPGIVAGPPDAAAASPEPSAPGGDTRSVGEGPGLVGAPFLAIAGIVALGLVAAGVTLLWLRLTAGPKRPGSHTGHEARPRRRDGPGTGS